MDAQRCSKIPHHHNHAWGTLAGTRGCTWASPPAQRRCSRRIIERENIIGQVNMTWSYKVGQAWYSSITQSIQRSYTNVCIVSRLLTDVESRYSQVEKSSGFAKGPPSTLSDMIASESWWTIVQWCSIMETPKSKPQARIERSGTELLLARVVIEIEMVIMELNGAAKLGL